MLDYFFDFFSDKKKLEKKIEEKESIIKRYSEVSLQLKNDYLDLKSKTDIYERASHLFNEILSSMNSGILLLKPIKDNNKESDKIIFVNKFFLELFNINKIDLKDDPKIFLDCIEGEGSKELIYHLNSLKKGSTKCFYLNIVINIESKRRIICINGRNTEYNNSKCIILTVNDLTLEEEYKYKSNLFNSLFIFSSVGALVVDMNCLYDWIRNNKEGIKNNANFIEFNIVNIREIFKKISVKSLNKSILDMLSTSDFYTDKEAFIDKIFYSNRNFVTSLVFNMYDKKEEFDLDLLTKLENGTQFILNIKVIIPPECYIKENFNQVLIITKNFDINENFSNTVSSNKDLIQWRENENGKIFSANKSALENFFGISDKNLSDYSDILPTSKIVKELGKPCRFYYRKHLLNNTYWYDIWSTPMYNVKGTFIGIVNISFNRFEETEEFLKNFIEDPNKFKRVGNYLYLMKN